ncbi:MAG: TlpA family protein disulfide reductase [Nitrospinota bacterium]
MGKFIRFIAIFVLIYALGYLFGVSIYNGEQHDDEDHFTTAMPVSEKQASTSRDIKYKVGLPLPDFTLTSTTGRLVTPNSFNGKWIYLNFWASWCPPCIEEMDDLQTLHNRLNRYNVDVVLVNVENESPKTIEKWLQNRGITLESLLDPEGELAGKLDVTTYPITFIIDRDRLIQRKMIGKRQWGKKKDLEGLIKYFENEGMSSI